MFNNKIILITGGTGSFGNTIVKYFIKTKVSEVRVFSRDEKKQDEMRNEISNDKLKFYLGDVRDKSSLREVIKNVDFIFHAAALKQVPSCEFFPIEAYKTNTLGTANVIDVAEEFKVKKVVILSTDKAVYPINAMGLSKAMAEKIAIAKSNYLKNTSPVISITRYGNVMNSRGSVIPLFISQIINKKDVTVTDPNMTRFLMSLDESVDLVMHAFKKGGQGDIFVQKSPSTTIKDLAECLIEAFKSNSKIRVIGTRHGEKLYETLIAREEMNRAKDLGKYFCISADNRDLNYKKYFTEGKKEISGHNDYTSHNTTKLSRKELKKLLRYYVERQARDEYA